MSSTNMIRTTPNFEQQNRNHRFQILEPQSCGTEALKVANLRRHLVDLESQMQESEKIADRLELLSKAKLVTLVVQDSCIGFLDLAAAMLKPLPGFGRAAEVASRGAETVKVAKDVSEYSSGQMSGGKLGLKIAERAAGKIIPGDTLGGKAGLKQAKVALGAVAVAMGETSGADFTKDALKENANFIKDAMAETATSSTSKGVFKGVDLMQGIVEASLSYQESLEKSFNARIDEKMDNMQFIMNQRQTIKKLTAMVKERLASAIAELDACLAKA